MLDPRWHATKEGKLSDLKISCNNHSNFEDREIKKRVKEVNGGEGIVIWSPCDCPYYNKDVQQKKLEV